MSENIIIALITLVGSVLSSAALINWRLKSLEDKVTEHNGYTGTSWVTLKSIPANTFTKDSYYTFTSDLPDVVCTQYKAIVSNNRVDLRKKIGPIKLLIYKRKV